MPKNCLLIMQLGEQIWPLFSLTPIHSSLMVKGMPSLSVTSSGRTCKQQECWQMNWVILVPVIPLTAFHVQGQEVTFTLSSHAGKHHVSLQLSHILEIELYQTSFLQGFHSIMQTMLNETAHLNVLLISVSYVVRLMHKFDSNVKSASILYGRWGGVTF